MLHVCNIEKHSAVLENVAGVMRLDAYVYGPITKWRHCVMFIHWRKNLFGLPNTVEVATSAELLEVQTRPRVLVYDWDP